VKSGIVTQKLEVQNVLSTAIDSKGTAEHILTTLANIVQDYLDQYDSVRGVGIGFPSPFDYKNGISLIQGVDKYEAILNMDIGKAIRERVNDTELLILFRNDAEAALVGEAIYGAGKPYSRFIGLTLGTGMGSSFIVDGQRVESGDGVPEGGFLFPVEFRGQQADEWFSTRGLLNRFKQADKPFDSVWEAAAAAKSDSTVQEVFAMFGHDMAIFIQAFLNEFEAEALLISGGIANAYSLFGEALEMGVHVPVVRGELGNEAALLGAADLILNYQP
jgi:glucokinase